MQLSEGLDNIAYEVNGELIVRFSKEADPAQVELATAEWVDCGTVGGYRAPRASSHPWSTSSATMTDKRLRWSRGSNFAE